MITKFSSARYCQLSRASYNADGTKYYISFYCSSISLAEDKPSFSHFISVYFKTKPKKTIWFNSL